MRADPRKVLGAIVAAVMVLAGLALTAQGLWFAKHETDTLHLIDIVLRRADGAVPHLDYMTPLGLLAFEPFVLLHRAGLSLGASLVWGQVLVAALLAPAAIWIAVRRLSTPVAIAFGLMVVLLAGGMVFGGTDPKLSLSMHYNRWAWALSFLPLLVAALPSEREAPLPDGAIIGLAMAGLALLKATYFVAFTPAVIAGLILRGMGRTLAVSIWAGLALLAVFTAIYGAAIWPAYVGDLRTVMASDVRAAPAGSGWAQVALSPNYAAATVLAVISVLMLRAKAKSDPVGIILALMLPGAIYVSYQNYGNDPLWLLLWGLVLLSLPETARGWHKAPLVGTLALALITPVALNIAYSPLRQLTLPKSVFIPLFPGQPGREDVYAVKARMETVQGRVLLDREDGQCQLAGGAVGWMQAQVDELAEAQLSGAKVYVADLFNFIWLFGDFDRLSGAAPWYYGGLPGFEDADILVVPKCPIDAGVSARMVEMIRADSTDLIEDFESELMTVYEIKR